MFSDRTRQGFVRSSLGYPEVQRGKSMPLPPYESLEDPHLHEYFERRFGNIQYVARVSIIRVIRLCSFTVSSDISDNDLSKKSHIKE